ncbi:hypothetical protein [Mycolicibacterium sp.]|uniref:hypothetical protein n=1 Tax=Mycolicibacterium sp. TaxID=2320850 RepID=UPI0037C5F596
MTSPSDREVFLNEVREAIREHQAWASGNLGVPGMADSLIFKCECGWSGDDPYDHSAQAAVDAMVRRLGPLF